jgi:hypothetical protein
MKKVLGCTAGLITGAVLMLSAPLAMAHDRVSWSLSIGAPYPTPVYSPPPVVYVQPQPVYVRPQPVYIQPQPVYIAPAPVVQYRSYYPQPYYVEEVRIRPHRHWRHH